MKTLKKTVLATALATVLLPMSAGTAQAVATEYTYTGTFSMFYATATAFNSWEAGYNTTLIMPNDNGGADNPLTDPISGTMSIDWGTRSGSATIVAGGVFAGFPWTATSVVLTDIVAGVGGSVTANMLFHHGDAASTPCGVVNCDIAVAVTWEFFDPAHAASGFYTSVSSMPGGPFAGMQPTFSGTLTDVTAVPVPATAWIVGSGLLGLLGVGSARRKSQSA